MRCILMRWFGKETQHRREKQINIKLVLSTLRYLWAYKTHSLGEQGATALPPHACGSALQTCIAFDCVAMTGMWHRNNPIN